MSETADFHQDENKVQAPAWVVGMKGDREQEVGRAADERESMMKVQRETGPRMLEGVQACVCVWWESSGMPASSFLLLLTQLAATRPLPRGVAHRRGFFLSQPVLILELDCRSMGWAGIPRWEADFSHLSHTQEGTGGTACSGYSQ